jgi:phosphoribulokinase
VKPVYDHTTGTFGTPELVFPRPVVLAHGLFTLYSPQFSHFFDLGIYLDPQPELRLNWKIMRDINSRGYTISQVLQQLEDRQADAATYIEPQKVNAGLVIRFSLPRTPGGAFDLRIESKTLLLPNRFINTPYLSVSSNNGSGQIIEISGDIDHNTAQEIAGLLGFGDKNLLGRVGLYQQANEKAHSYTLALAQLISVSAIPGASTGHLPHVA